MTARRRDNQDTPFSAWLRNEPTLDSVERQLCVSDLDFWVHRYQRVHDFAECCARICSQTSRTR